MKTLNKIVGSFEAPGNLSFLLTIVWVIEKQFAPSTSSAMLLGQFAVTKKSELQHDDFMREVLRRTSGSANVKYLVESYRFKDKNYKYISFNYNLNDEDYFYRSPGKKTRAIWFIDSLQAFDRLESDLVKERYHYKRNGYFCIAYTGHQINLTQTMRTIFRRLFKIYVINVNFLVSTGRTTQVYTYQPFTKKKCQNSEPQLLGMVGAITHYNFSKSEFFLRKLTNMRGCKLHITTWAEPPFIILEGDQIKGIEGMLLEELAARKNFKIQLKEPPSNEMQYMYPNQTDKGFMRMLMERETNITIVGLMYDKNRLQVADAAYTYMNVPLVLAIPTGSRMSPWERILRPFKYIIWSCLSSSIVFGITIIFCIKKFFKSRVHHFVFGHSVRTPFTNLWNVLYGGPIHGPLPSRNFARYLLGLWFFYTFVLRTAYVGELFFLLKDARARSHLNTVAEVIENNFTFYTYPILERVLHDMAIPARNIHFIDSDKHSLGKLVKLLRTENSQIAVTILGPIVRAYNKQPENQAQQISVLPEPLFMAPLTFYMPKHSYLSFEFDDMLLKIMSAGLIKKYAKFYLGQTTRMHNDASDQQEQLSLWLLLGIFSIYLFLLLLCGLVFLIELRSRRSHLIRKLIDFFNC